MSAVPFNTRGKPEPRWSKAAPVGLLPLLKAGLPNVGRIVCVGPPLLASAPKWAGRHSNAAVVASGTKLVMPTALPIKQLLATTVPVVKKKSGPKPVPLATFSDTMQLVNVMVPAPLLLTPIAPP